MTITIKQHAPEKKVMKKKFIQKTVNKYVYAIHNVNSNSQLGI